MHALLAISDGAFPDPAARAVLLAGGLDAREAADLARVVATPDLVLLARPLGLADLLALARDVRAHPLLETAPIVAAIDRRDAGLLLPGAGIDEFLCRPLDPHELLSRARFLMFRTRRLAGEGLVTADDLVIDTKRYEVTVDGRRADLTLKEYELLLFLAQHRGQVFTRDVLLDRIWGHAYFGGTRTVDVHVRRVRMKIERAGRIFIDTVRGVGYKFNG